jgi:capsid protein
LRLPGDFFINPRPYYRAEYIPPGMEPVDPLRESKANRDDVAAGLRSPQEIVGKRGRELEHVYDEIAEAQELAEERGLILDTGNTALASAPSALDAGENRTESMRRMIQDELLLMEDIDK